MNEHDPNGLSAHVPGAKLDAGKTRVWLCIAGFSRALEEVAKVTTAGALKYTPNGWRDVPNGQERYMDAFGRHQLKLGRGEIEDTDTGCLHKAQMIWNLLASLELELHAQARNDVPAVGREEAPAAAAPREDGQPLSWWHCGLLVQRPRGGPVGGVQVDPQDPPVAVDPPRAVGGPVPLAEWAVGGGEERGGGPGLPGGRGGLHRRLVEDAGGH